MRGRGRTPAYCARSGSLTTATIAITGRAQMRRRHDRQILSRLRSPMGEGPRPFTPSHRTGTEGARRGRLAPSLKSRQPARGAAIPEARGSCGGADAAAQTFLGGVCAGRCGPPHGRRPRRDGRSRRRHPVAGLARRDASTTRTRAPAVRTPHRRKACGGPAADPHVLRGSTRLLQGVKAPYRRDMGRGDRALCEPRCLASMHMWAMDGLIQDAAISNRSGARGVPPTLEELPLRS